MRDRLTRAAIRPPSADLTPPGLRGQTPAPVAASPVTNGASASLDPAMGAAISPADPVKAEYDAAADLLKTQHYDAAQRGFLAFLQKNPHSRLIAPATYHLGESYYYQSRHREAAEQFLKIATDYSKTSVAPDAMVKLGVSLNALGAKNRPAPSSPNCRANIPTPQRRTRRPRRARRKRPLAEPF